MILLALIAIPIIAVLASSSSKGKWDTSDYQELYRFEDPDRYTPGQQQFSPGFLVITPGAEGVMSWAEDAMTTALGRDFSGKLIQNVLVNHSEGDWGDVEQRDPDWAADQDKLMESGGLPPWGVTGIHNIAGKEVWVKTVPGEAGNLTTFYLPSED